MNRVLVAFLVTVAVLFVAITMAKGGGTGAEAGSMTETGASADRDRVLRFWDRYREATAHRIAGRTAEAAAAYAEALTLDGEHEDALYYYGNMAFELGELAKAESAWQRLIAVNETSARAHSRLGDLYLCADQPRWFDPVRAEAEYRRAHDLNPEETGPLLHLAESALWQGDLAGAQARFEEVLRTNGGSVEAQVLRGYVDWKTGRTDEVAVRTARIADLLRDQPVESTGLNEGDTRGGTAMVATSTVCRGLGDLVGDLRWGERGGPTMDAQLEALYRHIHTALTGSRGSG